MQHGPGCYEQLDCQHDLVRKTSKRSNRIKLAYVGPSCVVEHHRHSGSISSFCMVSYSNQSKQSNCMLGSENGTRSRPFTSRWFPLLQVSLSYGLRLVLGPWLQQGAELPKVHCIIWQGKHLVVQPALSQGSPASSCAYIQDGTVPCCAGLLQVQQLHLKAGIIDAADLPFICTSGRLAAIKHVICTISMSAKSSRCA